MEKLANVSCRYNLTCRNQSDHEWIIIGPENIVYAIDCYPSCTDIYTMEDATGLPFTVRPTLYREGREAERLAIKRYFNKMIFKDDIL